MALSPSFESTFADAWPTVSWCDERVLIAVSGGADSIALLSAMARLKKDCGTGQLIVGHFNHRFRTEESDKDQQSVADLCQTLQIPCEIGKADASLSKLQSGEGLEAAARAARYEFLESEANNCGARYLVTAHTADDQAETILHRIIRGTGIAGLAGIPRIRRLNESLTLLRPLLHARRSEVIEYLQTLKQPFREDVSNQDWQFTRNRIRGELLPQLQDQYNPQVVEALLRLGRLAGESQSIIDGLVEEMKMRAIVLKSNTEVIIDCRQLSETPPYLIRQLFIALWSVQEWPQQAMNLSRWEELAVIVRDENRAKTSTKKMFPGEICVERQNEKLKITKKSPQ